MFPKNTPCLMKNRFKYLDGLKILKAGLFRRQPNKKGRLDKRLNTGLVQHLKERNKTNMKTGNCKKINNEPI